MAKHSKRHGREFWEQMMLEFEGLHGVTQRAFAESRGVNVDTFRQWIYRVRKERQSQAPAEMATLVRRMSSQRRDFVEVQTHPSALVTVRLGAVAVEFAAVPPPAWVAELASYGGH
ncbi:MAG: hypothetical protein R3E66_17230 [bacterium]